MCGTCRKGKERGKKINEKTDAYCDFRTTHCPPVPTTVLVSFNLLQVWKLNGKKKEKKDECDTRCKGRPHLLSILSRVSVPLRDM